MHLLSTPESVPHLDNKMLSVTTPSAMASRTDSVPPTPRSEVGDGYGNKKGSYTIADIDGRARRVDYVADGHGFRATVKTNEPGTAASAPAAALIASPYAGPVAPVVNHIAPAAPAVAVAAPVAYGAGALGLGHGAALGLGYGVGALGLGYGADALGLGHGAALGLGYGAGVYGAGLGKVIL
ncbi:hypothetical protein CEXT_74301 [Caerostris extrusa]|uniref:Uncharacterized protein n=1 Tax=Caerostris extrusa TaxID=172846 RepID=A0AAV4SD86_CAEEX|nr:hypothetical protein CEXT_74301 [Caerostris extrusa]